VHATARTNATAPASVATAGLPSTGLRHNAISVAVFVAIFVAMSAEEFPYVTFTCYSIVTDYR
jgi:hypothetical protein